MIWNKDDHTKRLFGIKIITEKVTKKLIWYVAFFLEMYPDSQSMGFPERIS